IMVVRQIELLFDRNFSIFHFFSTIFRAIVNSEIRDFFLANSLPLYVDLIEIFTPIYFEKKQNKIVFLFFNSILSSNFFFCLKFLLEIHSKISSIVQERDQSLNHSVRYCLQ
ncbi:hypothetical protein SSS_01265, partial [Sarcoptes scabiei]